MEEKPKPRFVLSGSRLEFIQPMDTMNTEVEIHELKTSSTFLRLEMIRSKKASPFGAFLVAKVSDATGRVLWSFPKSFNGYGKLTFFEGLHLVYLEDKGRKMYEVILVEDLPKATPVAMGEQTVFLGGRSRLELFQLKMRLAKRRGRDYAVLSEEEKLRDKLREFEAVLKLEQKEAAAVAAVERKERQAAILSRPDIVAYTYTGQRVYGTPVVGDEWKALPDGKGAILVEFYDSQTGDTGALIAAFFVKKSGGGRCEQERRQENLSVEPPAKKARLESGAPVAKALGVLLLEVEGSPVEVFHFDKKNFLIFRQQKVNSGALIAVGELTANGTYSLIRLDGDKYPTVGQGKPL